MRPALAQICLAFALCVSVLAMSGLSGCAEGSNGTPDTGAVDTGPWDSGNDEDTNEPCRPRNCDGMCGVIDDSCGGELECTCDAPETCGGAGVEGVCGCPAATCEEDSCGTVPDGCGLLLSCGSCPVGTCIDNVCVCEPATCRPDQCGTLDDGCGGMIECGGCLAPATCGGDGEENVCGCTPTTCVAAGAGCGAVDDTCGGMLDCGGCEAPLTCGGAGTPNVCGCPRSSCEDLGATCGMVPDGCGGEMSCGVCAAPETCGGAGVPNDCGCTPRTCASLGANCGIVGNGCGGTLSCGTCASPQTCGGGGTPRVCGCTPRTCADIGATCGALSDGCGGSLFCGACVAPETCGGGALPNGCGAPTPGSGDLVITEILRDPLAVSDSAGEWFELFNAAATGLDLEGCVITDLGRDTHTVTGSLLVERRGRLVLARNADVAINGGVDVDYRVNGTTLGNGEDEIIITCRGVEIDRVVWDATFPAPSGASMTLRTGARSASANDDAANWCAATTVFGAGDRGTPGDRNDACP